jgi:hypothetical protein
MFQKKTLIVVGAGASKEVGLPTGAELKEKIASLLDITFEHGYSQKSGDYLICRALQEIARNDKQYAGNINLHLHAGWRIRDATQLAMSIDSIIDTHRGDKELETCGKLAIVRAILDEERKCKLYFDISKGTSTINYRGINDTWYTLFFRLLTEECVFEMLAERVSSIALVIFNYDRCVEHFLYHSLQAYYAIDPDKASELVRSIKIFHPYGTSGTLPWYGEKERIEFGGEPGHEQLVKLAGQIKTFTEGTDPEASDIREIKDIVWDAKIVTFLGFGYHRQNLDILNTGKQRNLNRTPAKYYGTAYDLSDSDCKVLIKELAKLGTAREDEIFLRNNLKCAGLIKEYWRSLALS